MLKITELMKSNKLTRAEGYQLRTKLKPQFFQMFSIPEKSSLHGTVAQ